MIRVIADREAALKVGTEALAERVKVEPAAFEGFDAKAICNDDKPFGMFLQKGPEVHVAILKDYRRRWLSRGLIRELLGGVMRQHGYVVTSVMTDNAVGNDFVQRLGFRLEYRKGAVNQYRMP